MNTITVGDRKFVKYILENEIEAAVDRVAAAVNEEYKNDTPVILLVLNGSVIFGADLLKRLEMPCKLCCVKVSSYVGTKSTDKMKQLIGLSEDVTDKRVLVIEDIIDTGNTLKKLKEMLLERQPASVRICTAFDKPDRRVNDLVPDFNGIVIPDKFIVGYGLDFDGQYRNFKDVRIVSFIE